MRAARGLLANKLTTPEAISEAPLEEEVEALHSEGNVQRGESSACADTVLEQGIESSQLFLCHKRIPSCSVPPASWIWTTQHILFPPCSHSM